MNKNAENAGNSVKKKAIAVFLLVVAIAITLICFKSCSKQTFSIVFKDYDGTVLDTQLVEKGEMPVFEGVLERKADDMYEYTFVSWDKPIVEAIKNETYTAIYQEKLIKVDNIETEPNVVGEVFEFEEEPVVVEEPEENLYYWVNFLDADGSLLERKAFEAGTVPSYSGTNRDGFLGWSPALHKVYGTQNYTATYQGHEEESNPAPVQMVTITYWSTDIAGYDALMYSIIETEGLEGVENHADELWNYLAVESEVSLPIGTEIHVVADSPLDSFNGDNLLVLRMDDYYDHPATFSNGQSEISFVLESDTVIDDIYDDDYIATKDEYTQYGYWFDGVDTFYAVYISDHIYEW